MKFAKASLSHDTLLTDLNLQHMNVILTERFLLPPTALQKIGETIPRTVGDIARLSGMSLDEIQQVFDECSDLSDQLYLTLESLDNISNADHAIILDMRPHIQMEDEPLHPNARMFHLESPQKILPFLRSLNQVVVLSDRDDHAWSAALSLKKMGIRAYLPIIAPANSRN